MAENSTSINLLPQKGESFLTQFLNWTLSIGRLLIIITEMVALGTFLYRFDLDMKIVDLHDKIKGQSAIVTAFQNSEDSFRNLHERLELIKRYDSIGSTTTGIFKDITSIGRGKITFRNLTVAPENAKIEAQAPSSADLSQFVAALRNHPSVTSVVVNKVENSTTSSLITVSITASLRPTAFEQSEQKSLSPGVVPILNNQ